MPLRNPRRPFLRVRLRPPLHLAEPDLVFDRISVNGDGEFSRGDGR